jgi:hypothetical protein
MLGYQQTIQSNIEDLERRAPPEFRRRWKVVMKKLDVLEQRKGRIAKEEVLPMYDSCIKAGFTPQQGRELLVYKWSHYGYKEDTILKYLPREAKSLSHSIRAQKSVQTRKAEKIKKYKRFDERFPQLKETSPKVKDAIREHLLPKIEKEMARAATPPGCSLKILSDVKKVTFYTSKGRPFNVQADGSYRLYIDGKVLRSVSIA